MEIDSGWLVGLGISLFLIGMLAMYALRVALDNRRRIGTLEFKVRRLEERGN